MHLLLTDRLCCPRCGPPFGLILLAERMEERRVLEGALGCPNCRDRFPVRKGFGDLRAPPRPELSAPDPGATEPLGALEVAALLGVAEGPGHAALVGPVAARAGEVADRVPELELVAVDAGLREAPERGGVSRMVARPGLPFFTGSLRGVVLSGADAPAFLDEAMRVVAPGARVVVLDGSPANRSEVRTRIEGAGLRVLLDEARAVVATRPAPAGGRAGASVALPVFPGPGSPETHE